MAIPPGETFEYHIQLGVKRPGPFEGALVIFLEDNGIREVTITLKGQCEGTIAPKP